METETALALTFLTFVVVFLLACWLWDKYEYRRTKERIRAREIAYMRTTRRPSLSDYPRVYISSAEWDEWYQEAMSKPPPPMPDRPSLQRREG